MLFRGKIFKAGLKTLSGNLRCFKDGLIWQEIVWKEGNDRNTSVILGGGRGYLIRVSKSLKLKNDLEISD